MSASVASDVTLGDVTGICDGDNADDVVEHLLEEIETITKALVALDCAGHGDDSLMSDLLSMAHRKARAASRAYGNRQHLPEAEREAWLRGLLSAEPGAPAARKAG